VSVKKTILSVETMKMRIIKMDPDFIMQILQGKTEPFTSNLPSDIELLDLKYDLFSKQVTAIIRSNSFEDIVDTYPIPEFKVTHTKNVKPESQTAPSTKVEAKPTKEPNVQTSNDVKGVEKEFSPEQRELLSFTIDGDYVVVKPIQYLKAEWNEINDVVKSIGGRWVKGDISSYWEIPIL
jgi:SET domain-containing protein